MHEKACGRFVAAGFFSTRYRQPKLLRLVFLPETQFFAAVRAVEHGILFQTDKRKRGGRFVLSATRAGERDSPQHRLENNAADCYDPRHSAPEHRSSRRLREGKN